MTLANCFFSSFRVPPSAKRPLIVPNPQVTRFYQFREEVLEGQFSSVVAVVNNHQVLEYQRLAQLDNFIQVHVTRHHHHHLHG